MPGMVLVPREPTEAMVTAGYATDALLCREDVADVWHAMLSAAPDAVEREEIARIVKAAVNWARASETCPVMSFNIKWRIKECDEAVTDAADAILSALGRTEAARPVPAKRGPYKKREAV